jgi:ribonuclease G
MPNLAGREKLYTKDYPIFEEYGVQTEIDKALKSKVWLKSGGSIVINQTEALVAIDVNTGRYVGKRTGRLEDTIVKTNLEAIKEIVRQIRLRDLGGIIVLDFIDMEERKNRQKVLQAVELELKKDRSPSKVLQVSDFGLVIITRKRVKQSLERVLTEPCPYCSGTGVIKSSSTICYEILSEVKKIGGDLNGHGVILRVNPEIARALKEEERAVMADLKNALGKDIVIRPDTHLHHEQFDVMAQ